MHTDFMITDHAWMVIDNIYQTFECLLLIEGGDYHEDHSI